MENTACDYWVSIPVADAERLYHWINFPPRWEGQTRWELKAAEKRVPVCGLDRCALCGDCMHCCGTGICRATVQHIGPHRWVVPYKSLAEQGFE